MINCIRVLLVFVAIASCPQGIRMSAAADTATQKYTDALFAFASQRATAGTPRYFAIVRRGMDHFDMLKKNNVDVLAELAGGASFANLDDTVTAFDEDPNGQAVTTRRLGIQISSERIVGGLPVGRGVRREVVALTGNNHLCSGTAVNNNTVLTAAHCACLLKIRPGDGNDDDKLVFVGNKVKGDPGNPTQSFHIDVDSTSFFSPRFSCSNLAANVAAGNVDLALIKIVKKDAPMNVPAVQFATPAEFAAAVPSLGGSNAAFSVYGFGCTQPIQSERFIDCTLTGAGVKMFGLVTNSRLCERGPPRGLPDDPIFGRPEDVCGPGAGEFVLTAIDSDNPVDTCAGDSGGPVMLTPNPGVDSRFVLAGVTSRALQPRGICKFGGIYERLATEDVIAWLGQNGVVIPPQ